MLGDIAEIVLEPGTRFPEGEDINASALWHCSDGKMCRCWPILASWLADPMEHANLMVDKYNACPKCQTPTGKNDLTRRVTDREAVLGQLFIAY